MLEEELRFVASLEPDETQEREEATSRKEEHGEVGDVLQRRLRALRRRSRHLADQAEKVVLVLFLARRFSCYFLQSCAIWVI